MSVADEITRLQSAKTAIAAAIEDKGVTVPAATKLDGMAALIGQISGGGGSINAVKITYTLPLPTRDNTIPWSAVEDAGFSYTTRDNLLICVRGNYNSTIGVFACARKNGLATNNGTPKLGIFNATDYWKIDGWTSAGSYPYLYYDANGIYLKNGSAGWTWASAATPDVTIVIAEI